MTLVAMMQILDDTAAACLTAFLPRDLTAYLRLRVTYSQPASPALAAALTQQWLAPAGPGKLPLGHTASALPLLLPAMLDDAFVSQLCEQVWAND